MAILEAVFADKPGQTPQEVERRRRMAQALMEAGSGGPPPSSGLELAGRLAMNLMGQYQAGKAEKQDASNRTAANKALIDAVYGGSSDASPSFNSQVAATSPSASVPSSGGASSGVLPTSFLAAVDAKEGAGGYDTLYGHAQRGKFAGTNVSAMPIRDVIAFTDPSGAYAQSVKSQIGRVATPVGRHQIVGTTLRKAVTDLGLDPNATFDQATQDRIALHLAKNRVASADTMSGKISALRSEWHGFKSVPDAQMAQIVADIEGAPVQVASLDPSVGMPPRTASEAVTAMGAGGSAPGSLSDEVAAYQQTPEYAARFPGRAVAPSFPGKQADDMDVAALPQPRNVGALPVPPNAQPMPQGIPAEFAGSQQLANAQGGIVPALMGGTAASPEQIAQARALGAAQPQPQAQPAQDNRALIATLLGNPYTAEAGQQLLMQEMQRRQEANDPVRAMQMEEQRLKLEAMRNPKPEYDIISGKDGSIFRADKRAGTVEQVYGGKPDLPTDVQEYEYARGQGYKGTFAEFQTEQKRAGATNVNIDQKAEGAFDKKLAEKQAETFDTMATEGLNARADIGIINELDTLLKGQGGTLSGIAGIAAKYGVGGEGIGDLQAVQALINKLVPTQRAPGSGSMSDRDVELFTRSLPSLWNEPGGNAKILRVMRGLAEYKQAQGEIADQVLTGDMSRQEARRALRSLPNPLAQTEPKDEAGSPPAGVDAEDWKYMTPEERKLFQ